MASACICKYTIPQEAELFHSEIKKEGEYSMAIVLHCPQYRKNCGMVEKMKLKEDKNSKKDTFIVRSIKP